MDVSYYDLLKDPQKEVKRIYDFAGIDYSEAAVKSVNETKKRNVQNRYGKHVYHLKDFDLSREQIEAQYGYYRERYHIPFE